MMLLFQKLLVDLLNRSSVDQLILEELSSLTKTQKLLMCLKQKGPKLTEAMQEDEDRPQHRPKSKSRKKPMLLLRRDQEEELAVLVLAIEDHRQ